MSAEADQAAATAALLDGRYEWVQRERVASFLGAHPQLVPLLEDLHCRLATAFPGARIVLRHLTSPRVPSPEGDGHILVVVVPAAQSGESSAQLSGLLRQWAPQQAATGAFLLVDIASAAIDPFASEEDAAALYIRRRSEDYKQYLDVARRFLDAPSGSDERALAAAELSTARLRAQGKVIKGRGGDPHEVLARLRRARKAAADAG
jgi:hypothetical protein